MPNARTPSPTAARARAKWSILAIAMALAIAFACSTASKSTNGDPQTPPDGGGSTPPPNGTGGGGGLPRRDAVNFFISGHSLTDEPLGTFVLALAESAGLSADYELQSRPGSPIRARTRGDDPYGSTFPGYHLGGNREGVNMDVLAELADPARLPEGERYDTLVITERHDLLLAIRWEHTVSYLRHYHDRFVVANPEGRTFLYHSWLALDKDAPEPWISYERDAVSAWECVASNVNLTLADEGRSDRVVVLPVGGALSSLVERALDGEVPGITGSTRERLDALFRDDVHLTRLGAYYAALVTYAALFGRSPEGLAIPEDLDAETASALQPTAARYVEAYYATPHERDMAECRALLVELCAPFHPLHGTPQLVAECEAFYADEDADGNPFRWPDPTWAPLPPP